MERDVESWNAVRAETDRRLAETDRGLAEIDRGLKDLIRQSEQLDNFRMEQKVHAKAGYFSLQLNLRRIRILKSPFVCDNEELQDGLAEAEDQGLISMEQGTEILAADIIFRGQRRGSAQPVYAVVEASHRIADQDIVHAADRAQNLALAMKCETLAVAVGMRIEPQQQTLAQSCNVAALMYPE